MPLLAMEAPFWMAGLWPQSFVPTAAIAKTNYKSWNLVALAADTGIAFLHGFKQTAPSGDPNTDVAPDFLVLTPTNSTIALAAAFGVTTDAIQITVTKQGAVNSGGAVPGTSIIAKVFAWRPHSIAE